MTVPFHHRADARAMRPDIAGLIEVAGYAFRAPADGKGKTAKIRHDGKHRFVGDVVADEQRMTALNGSRVINSSTPVA